MSAPLDLDGSRALAFDGALGAALAASVVTGRAFHLRSIRDKELRPGLRPAQVSAVRAALLACDARVGGLFDGSPELRFEPSAPRGGDFTLGLPEGVATTPLLALLLPILNAASGPSSVELEGATHLPGVPLPEFLSGHLSALLAAAGFGVRVETVRAAYTSKGGGCLRAHIEPRALAGRSLALDQRGLLRSVRVRAGASRLRRDLAERATRTVASTLWESRRLEVETEVLEPDSASPGSWLCVEAVFEQGRAAFAALGERGLAPEALGDRLARRLLHFIEDEEGGVDPLSAELLAVPLAVAGVATRVSAPEVSPALAVSLEVLAAFGLPVAGFGRVGGPGGFEVRAC